MNLEIGIYSAPEIVFEGAPVHAAHSGVAIDNQGVNGPLLAVPTAEISYEAQPR
jgi:hypothetical protein